MEDTIMNTLETIIDEILEHDEIHPDHGRGCTCHDKHARTIRRLILKKMANKPQRYKSLANLFTVIRYVDNNRPILEPPPENPCDCDACQHGDGH